MPITLGCQSCGKRFRARDESAGKRVKCPFCAAPVTVPTAEESASAAAPTAPIPSAPPRSTGGASPPPARPAIPTKTSPLDDSGPVPAPAPRRPTSPPPAAPAPVASPADWGATASPRPSHGDSPKPVPKPAKARGLETANPTATKPEKSPEQLAIPGWRKMRGGLFWVSFALFWLCFPALTGVAKEVCAKTGVELPKGKGFISIPGVLNGDSAETFQMTAEAQLDALAYGAPVLLAGLALVFGRLTCAAVPRASGAKGMFLFSSLFTLLALAGLVTAAVCMKVLNYEVEMKIKEIFGYGAAAFLVGLVASEFWFLTGLAASGATLGEPKAVRAVGLIGFFGVLTAAWALYGWQYYASEFRAKLGDDRNLYEQGALGAALLVLIIVYWRPVRKVRRAIREYLDAAA